MDRDAPRTLAPLLAIFILVGNARGEEPGRLEIPAVRQIAKRLVTIDDISALRKIDSLSVSSDGQWFAMFVRQADPVTNTYRTGWFVGSTSGGKLINVGYGGDLEGGEAGLIAGSESLWSPDGQWIAYTLRRAGEVQLWRSRVDGSRQEQVTHHAGDVEDFAWSKDGRELYFTAGVPRATQRAAQEAKVRAGYQYDEDLNSFTDLMQSPANRSLPSSSSLWVLSLSDEKEHLGSQEDHVTFALAGNASSGGGALASPDSEAPKVSVARSDGALAQLIPVGSYRSRVRMVAERAQGDRKSIECSAPECTGYIYKVWWSEDNKSVYFSRYDSTFGSAFYRWSPSTGAVEAAVRLRNDVLSSCAKAAGDRIVCVREMPTRPSHVSVLDLHSGSLEVLADVNPEFANIRLGRVERYEWDLPKFAWNEPGGALAGLYGARAHGYILYPPNFDPARKYPVFIDPYVAGGFDHPSRAEHATHVYAANGFIVLNLGFPAESEEVAAALGDSLMSKAYSPELDFPLLTMDMESTVRGLDAAAQRGFIDRARVGIGGVSHGTFVPLYMLQKHDLIAAISVSSPHWGPFQYYWGTRKLREASVDQGWPPKPDASNQRVWQGIDIAEHVDTIEAPVLMNLADRETFALLRLIRHMADAGKPYDAYIFPNEGHIKWQPAHLHAIMNRNLDWFRFWLQDYEDSAPGKEDQYARWRKLRELHCRNLRSSNNVCQCSKTARC